MNSTRIWCFAFCTVLLCLVGWAAKFPQTTVAQSSTESQSSIVATREDGAIVIASGSANSSNHFVLTLNNDNAILITEQAVTAYGADLQSSNATDQTALATLEIAQSNLGETRSNTVVINGMGGNDLLTIDLRNGTPLPNGQLIFHGGGQHASGVGDALALVGGSAHVVTHRFVNANDGSIEILKPSATDSADADSLTIVYTGLEPVVDNLSATDRTFSFTGGSEEIVLNSGTDANDGQLFIDSTLGESVLFTQPTASLTIRTTQGSGTDTVQLVGLDDGFDADITVTADDDDSVAFTTAATNAGSGTVQVDAGTVSVDANVSSLSAIQLAAADTINVSGDGITGGDISLAAGADITIGGATGVDSQFAGGRINIDAGGSITVADTGVQGTSTIDMQSVDDMLLSQVWSFSPLANTIELTSTNGALLDGSDDLIDISAPLGTIVVRAANGVGEEDGLGADAALDIHAGSLDIVAGSDIDLVNPEGIGGLYVDAGAGDIDLFALGVITDTDSDVDLVGNRATITASGGVGNADAPLEMALNELEIDTSLGLGDLYLQESDTVTVTTLTANNGNVFLLGGTFLVQDSIQNPVVIASANLGGRGQVIGSVTFGGSGSITPGFSPAFSPGVLTIDGDLSLNSDVTITAEINQPVAGSGYDQVLVSGAARNVTLDDAELNISLSADYVHNEANEFMLIKNDAASSTVSGIFRDLPEGAVIRLPNAAFSISYAGGDGNDVVLESIPLYSIEAINGGTGGGNLAIAPFTIDGVYLPGTVVTITATPLITSTFDGWLGDASGTTNPLTITMDADKSVTALFNTITYTLTTNVDGRGNGTVSLTPPGGTYEIGTIVEVEAIAGADSLLSKWSGAATGQTNPITLTMDANRELTATFKILTYTISIATAGDGIGTVELDPAGNVYDVNTTVSASAVAASGSRFAGWDGLLSGTDTPAEFTAQSDATVMATFEIIPMYTLTIDLAGDGTVVLDPPGGTYEEGTKVTITATAEDGSRFGGWGGLLSGTETTATTTASEDGIIVATFNQIPSYTLSIRARGDGEGSFILNPSGGRYEEGTVVTITPAPAIGSVFQEWLGTIASTDNPLTVTVDQNIEVSVIFGVRLMDVRLPFFQP